MRVTKSFSIDNLPQLKGQLLNWSQQFEHISWLDSNEYPQQHTNAEAILAVNALDILQSSYIDAFAQLEKFQQKHRDWLFGYLGYDLKNDVEDLTSANHDDLDFPDLYFFRPEKVIILDKMKISFHYIASQVSVITKDFDIIRNTKPVSVNSSDLNIDIKSKITKEEYFEKGKQLLKHIYHGNIYEANFCQEFYAKNVIVDPLRIYKSLNQISKPPFAAFLKLSNYYACCASPERYLKKDKQVLLSQPIKGTAKRHLIASEDKNSARNLLLSEKERAENVMIVDLVRNDLSKTAVKGSVKVTELYQLYSFKQVHQLISTITSKLKDKYSAVEALKCTFPMGSMTGAPKISAMQIIEKNEASKRGLYSGAIGYFTPTGDFDFNVVIRSILYNSKKNYVSFSVGSAITALSDLNEEYEECLLKAEAMRSVLTELPLSNS